MQSEKLGNCEGNSPGDGEGAALKVRRKPGKCDILKPKRKNFKGERAITMSNDSDESSKMRLRIDDWI